MHKTIGVIAAHPDDEILGCGGAIAKHALAGDEVHILILAQGEMSRTTSGGEGETSDKLSALKRCALEASEILGAKTVDFLDFPDNRMDTLARLDIIKKVEAFIDAVKPCRIYTHGPCDVNVDHTLSYESVITAARPMPNSCVKEILCFEVLSSTEWRPSNSGGGFKPNFYIPLTNDECELKLKALSAYQSELREWPHPRSLKACSALMQYRGSCVGFEAVEAFEICRMIAT